jgi:hypothetical protein
MGHSMGGGCSVLAASYNTNFHSVINFAAAETEPSAIQAASNVFCPSLIFSANDDNIAPPSGNQLPIYENISADLKYHINMFDENHFSLTSNSNLHLLLFSFITYIVSSDAADLGLFQATLDSLQAQNELEFVYVNNISSTESFLIPKTNEFSIYPNPFNPSTAITFAIQEQSFIEISIYNAKGQKVKILAKRDFTKGTHSLLWNGDDYSANPLSSGIYFVTVREKDVLHTAQKCLLIK